MEGIEINQDHCRQLASRGLMNVTVLVPIIGYDRAVEISRRAQETGQSIFETALEEGILPEEELKTVLDLDRMTEPDPPG